MTLQELVLRLHFLQAKQEALTACQTELYDEIEKVSSQLGDLASPPVVVRIDGMHYLIEHAGGGITAHMRVTPVQVRER